jgi:guanine deaminase
MQKAINEAIKGVNQNHGGPFGAVIVKNGEIVSTAHNEVLKSNDPTSHAEINAIKKASKKLQTFDLSGCDIYTTCMPCPMCMGAIRWANISNIYYGATSEDAQSLGFRDKVFYDEEHQNIKNIDRTSCLSVFRIWSQKPNKTIY